MSQLCKHIFITFLLASFSITNLHAQSATYETFGRIKMQKDVMEWRYLDTTNFRIFYYSYGKYNAQYLLQQAEIDLPTICKLVNTNLSKKVNVVLYNSFKDYKQTNIGRSTDALNTAEGGKLDISGNNIVIYFDGTHDGLRKQLRKGVVKTLRDNLLYGMKLKDIIKKAQSSTLPDWFSKGYLNYLSEDWTADESNLIRNEIQNRLKYSFDDLAQLKPELIGKSFFNFCAEKYGETQVNNIMYMANGGSSIQKIFTYVFNRSYKEVIEEWKEFYCPMLAKDSTPILNRKLIGKLPIPVLSNITKFSMSPDGKSLAYVVEKQNVYKINILDISANKSFTIIEGGMRHGMEFMDPQYPIIAWSLNGKKLAVMYEKEAYQRLKVWDAKKGRISERIFTTNKFDRIHSMTFMEDDEKLLISAIKKGQSDLYQFVTKGGQLVNVTKDIWDEINPMYVQGRNFDGILFFSNRDKNSIGSTLKNGELPNTKFHLYYYNAATGSPILFDCSKDAELPISQPIQYGAEAFCFLADENGYKQRYIFSMHKDINGKDSTSFLRNAAIDANIVYHSYNRKENAIIDIILRNNKYEIYSQSIKMLDSVDKANETPFVQRLVKTAKIKSIDSLQPTSYILTEFVDDIDSLDALKNYVEKKTETTQPKKFRPKEYKRSFYIDNTQASLDNSLLFNRYQKLDQSNAPFSNSPLSSMLTTNLVDVMEDYRITGAFRRNQNKTFSYLAKFGNYKRRLDWEILFIHNADTIIRNNSKLPVTDPFYSSYNQEFGKAAQNYLQGNLLYPFNATTSVRFTSGIRNEHLQYNAVSEYSIKYPTANEFWWFNRAEYIYDNTTNPLLNISKGLKYKIWGEAFQQITKGKGSLYTYGADLRYYMPIFKNIILANRITFGASGGATRMLYRVGGVDNDMNPLATNYSNQPISKDSLQATKYGYQTPATLLRGYKQNDLNGSSYLIWNEELRLPIMNTISARKIRNKALSSLQLIAFADLGSTGTGLFPGGYTYTYNGLPSINSGTVISNISNYESSLFGYGFGARSLFLGYFVRADIGWGTISRIPQIHVSLVHDF